MKVSPSNLFIINKTSPIMMWN